MFPNAFTARPQLSSSVARISDHASGPILLGAHAALTIATFVAVAGVAVTAYPAR
jgi:hypothetical protein